MINSSTWAMYIFATTGSARLWFPDSRAEAATCWSLWGFPSVRPQWPNFMLSIISGEESSVCKHNKDTKHQSSQRKNRQSAELKKARQVRRTVKTVLLFFFNTDRVVHFAIIPRGQNANSKCYCDVLRHLKENIWTVARWQLGSPTWQRSRSQHGWFPLLKFSRAQGGVELFLVCQGNSCKNPIKFRLLLW